MFFDTQTECTIWLNSYGLKGLAKARVKKWRETLIGQGDGIYGKAGNVVEFDNCRKRHG